MEHFSFDGESKRLVIDSKGICVICFKQSDLVLIDDANSNRDYLTIPNYSTKRISRFLKIPVGKLLSVLRHQIREPQPISNAHKGKDKQVPDLKVALCAGCASITEEFSELHEQMEKVELQINHCLSRLCNRIRVGDGNQQRKEWFWRRMSANQRDLSFSDLVETFRTETVEKCDLRLQGPRVRVQKLTEDELAKTRKLRSVVSTDTEEDDDDDSSKDLDCLSDPLRRDHDDEEEEEMNSFAEMPRLEMEMVVESIAIREFGRTDSKESSPPLLLPEVDLNALSTSSEYTEPLQNRSRIKRISFKCHICQVKFRKLEQLHSHVTLRHSGPRKHPDVQTTQSTLLEGQALLNASRAPILESMLDQSASPTNDQFPQILETFKPPLIQQRPFQCVLCHKIFKSDFSRKRHINVQHERRYQVNCQLCKKSFKFAYLLRKHLYRCQKKTPFKMEAPQKSPLPNNSYDPNKQCHICKKIFSFPLDLKSHFDKVHGTMKTYKEDIEHG